MINDKGAGESETKCLAIPMALHRPANKSRGPGSLRTVLPTVEPHSNSPGPIQYSGLWQRAQDRDGVWRLPHQRFVPKLAKSQRINSRCLECGISGRRIAQQSRRWQAHPSHASCHPTRLVMRLAGRRQIANLRVFLARCPATLRVPCSSILLNLDFVSGRSATRNGALARGGGWPWLAPGLAPGLAAPVRTYAVGRSSRQSC